MIADGPEKLNAFIDAGQVDELAGLIPKANSDSSGNEDTDKIEPDRKRPRRIRNHNAQLIYRNQDMQTNESPWSQPPPGMDSWPMMGAGAPPPSLLNMNVAPPAYDESNGNWPQSSSQPASQQQQQQPPSSAAQRKADAAKRRNRDSDGNRISRFDRESRPSRFDNADNNARMPTRRNPRRM